MTPLHEVQWVPRTFFLLLSEYEKLVRVLEFVVAQLAFNRLIAYCQGDPFRQTPEWGYYYFV